MIHIITQIKSLRALNMRRRGFKLKDIAKEFNITRERARQLNIIGERLEQQITSNDPWYELSARCRNALVSWGCEPTPNGVRQFKQVTKLSNIPSFGIKCAAELEAWLAVHK